MSIQYIGRKTYNEGKRLFDILCRLKNFGVGRIVLRNHYLERYSEPTYFVITKVVPDMSDPTQVTIFLNILLLYLNISILSLYFLLLANKR